MRLTSDEKFDTMQLLGGPTKLLHLGSERVIPIVKFKILTRSDPIDEHE